MTRFTYGTQKINFKTLTSLIAPGSWGHRIWPFSDQLAALTALMGQLPNVYEEFAGIRSPSSLPQNHEMLSEAPYYTQGNQIYQMLSDYFGDFIELYQDDWCSPAGGMADEPLRNFVARMDELASDMGRPDVFDIPTGISDPRSFKCQWLSDFHVKLTGVLFGVTAYHSQVGTVSALYLDPEFATSAWTPDGAVFPKEHLLLSTLASATGKTTPTLVETYSHLCKGIDKEDRCVKIFDEYRKKFVDYAVVIEASTQNDPLKYFHMNPGFIETSVAK